MVSVEMSEQKEGKMATANTRGKTRARNRAGGDVLENSASMSGSRALSGLNVGLNVGLGVRGVNSRPASVSASALLVSRAPSLSQSQSQSVSVSLALAPDVLLVAARKRVASATLPPQNLLAKRPRVPANSTVCNLQNENANSNNIANAGNAHNAKHTANPPPLPSKSRVILNQSLDKQPRQPHRQLPIVSRSEFKSFVFYLDASSKPLSLEAPIKELGAKTHFTFQRSVMTHYIVGESELNFVRNPTASLSSAASSSLRKRVEFATTWGCAVWSCSDLRVILLKLKKPIKPPSLATLIDDDKHNAHHPNAAAAIYPNAPLPAGYNLLHGRYILVEDVGLKHRPMHCKEWDDEEDGDGENAWPSLQLEGKADGRFRGNAFTPMYSDENEDEEEGEDAGQGEDAGRSARRKLGGREDDDDGSGMEESADEEEENRNVSKQQAAIEEEKRSGEEFGQDDDEATSAHEVEENYNFAEPVPTVNSNASGLNNTTSMRPQLERLIPSGKVAGLMAREIGIKAIQEKSATDAATTAMVDVVATENRKVDGQDASGVPSCSRKKQVIRKRKRTGPKGKDFYNRSGYCENCAEKYDHFIKHVHSTRHLAWAEDIYNFHTIDVFIATTERPLQPHKRSAVKNPFSPPSSSNQVPYLFECTNVAMRTPSSKRHQILSPSVHPAAAGKCTPIAQIKFKNGLAAAAVATSAPMAGSTHKSVFLSSMLCVHEKDLGQFERTLGDVFECLDGGAAGEGEEEAEGEVVLVGSKGVGERRRTRILSAIVGRVTLHDGEVVLHQDGIPVDVDGRRGVGMLRVRAPRAAVPHPAITDEIVPALVAVSVDSACGDNFEQANFPGTSVALNGRVKKQAASASMKRPLLV